MWPAETARAEVLDQGSTALSSHLQPRSKSSNGLAKMKMNAEQEEKLRVQQLSRILGIFLGSMKSRPM